jgi:uncharacterized metal-binding protein YceD (DUF177 family)
MPPDTTTLDLSSLPLATGEKSVYQTDLYLPPLEFAGQVYEFKPEVVKSRLEITFTGEGYHVTIEFICRLEGACWRCLEPADLDLDVRTDDYFELELPPLDQLGEEDEPSMWYTDDGILDLSAWAHDAVAGMLPPKILCYEKCRGLCPQCGINLNEAECGCQPPVDSRWEALRDWKPEA